MQVGQAAEFQVIQVRSGIRDLVVHRRLPLHKPGACVVSHA